ncbi:MAG: HAD-IIIC family phosphatase [Desulfobacter sp.]
MKFSENAIEVIENGTLAEVVRLVDSFERDNTTPEAVPLSLYVLRNYTLENLVPFIKLPLYCHGLSTYVAFSDFDSYVQDVLDDDSLLYRDAPGYVLVSLSLDNLQYGDYDPIEFITSQVDTIIELLKKRTSAHIILHTFLPSVASVSSCPATWLHSLNSRLKAQADSDNRITVIDLEKVVMMLGEEKSFDYRYGFMFKSYFTHHFFREWGKEIAKVVLSASGFQKKVLVADCDNTLWGGIIGEDGLEGIKLDRNDYPGNVYYTFQKQLIRLQKQGILLCLCSKNNENDVMDVITKHPHCLLKPEHLAAWRINWDDKASNLISLARELNVGVDSFVFIDDSHLECDRVRRAIPEVEVFRVPEKIYELPKILGNYRGFFRLHHTVEDAVRTEFYRHERLRTDLAKTYSNIDDYLSSLNLRIVVDRATKREFERVAQLTQKTNQFNLTTKRYGLQDIERFAESSLHLVVTLKAFDKFGEYGLTGVAIIENTGSGFAVDTLLLSCRILGRKIEIAFLAELLRLASEKWSEDETRFTYIQSPKNEQVRLFLDQQPYKERLDSEDSCVYIFTPESSIVVPTYIQVERNNS